MTLAGPIAVAIALALDLLVAEPPNRLHPVAWLGRAIAPFDREWSHPTAVGATLAVALPFVVGAAVAGVVALSTSVSTVVGTLVAGLALFSATSLRMLVGTAREVARESASDLPEARRNLRALAGRNAEDLSAGQVRSAAVESAAENLADGLVAPLLGFALLAPVSLPLAAGAAAWVKAVNTLDSMLGYPHKPVGRASARLDDLVMWVPARLSAILIAIAALDPGAVSSARRWADDPPSPNSGWPMATLATALGVRLEKPATYALNPDAAFPTVADAVRGARIVEVAGLLSYVLAGVVAWS